MLSHRYLPGIRLGENIIANPDLIATVKDADILVFCTPHQFVRDSCKKIAGHVRQGRYMLPY